MADTDRRPTLTDFMLKGYWLKDALAELEEWDRRHSEGEALPHMPGAGHSGNVIPFPRRP